MKKKVKKVNVIFGANFERIVKPKVEDYLKSLTPQQREIMEILYKDAGIIHDSKNKKK